ncbi:MAG: cupin domain-containing protein, partial [Chloroflexota bacterium]
FKPIFGRNLLFNYVFFEPHTEAPMHAHPEEQIGTMLEGEYEFEMNGEKRMIRPGDVYVVPPNVPHAARTFARGCIAVDIFSPPRSGFQAMLDRVTGEQSAGN